MKVNNIQKYRKEKNFTLSTLSQITGLSIGYLCHLEKGSRNNPSMNTAEKIANALNKTIAEIFSEE